MAKPSCLRFFLNPEFINSEIYENILDLFLYLFLVLAQGELLIKYYGLKWP